MNNPPEAPPERWLREFEQFCDANLSPTAVACELAGLGAGYPKRDHWFIPELETTDVPTRQAFNAAALCVLNKHAGLRAAVRAVLVRDQRHPGFYNGEFGRIANKKWAKEVVAHLLGKEPNPFWVGAEEPEPTGGCPLCEGPGMYQGTLGQRPHFRCRNCGIDFNG
jgi:hypothetical protein